MSWAQAEPCSECPFRLDVDPGQFPPERYEALAGTAVQQIGPVFACHKTVEGRDLACAGWLAVSGMVSLTGRIAALRGKWDPAEYAELRGQLHSTYAAVAIANGVPAETIAALLGSDVGD